MADMGTTAILRNAEQLADDDVIYVERLAIGYRNVVTAHAAADCPGITAGATVTATTVAENTGDLFCRVGCLEVPTRNWAAVYGAENRTTVAHGAQLDAGVERAAKAAAPKKVRNPATERQMDLIGKLMIEKGLADTDPRTLLGLSDNALANKGGQLTKPQASQIIDLLFKLDTVADAPAADVAPLDFAEVEEWLAGLPGKLDHADLDTLADTDEDRWAALEAAAAAWAATQVGADFDYLADIAAKAAAGQWNPRYLKGTLNCWRAQVVRGGRTATPAADAAPAAAAPTGRRLADLSFAELDEVVGGYLTPDGTAYFVTANRARTSHWAKVWTGDEWDYAGRKPLYKLTTDMRVDNLELAALFASATGACTVCGRKLTAKESIEQAMGPVCAAKF